MYTYMYYIYTYALHIWTCYIFTSFPLMGAGLSRMAKCVMWLHERSTDPFSNGVVSHPLLSQKSGSTPCLKTN